MLYVLREITEIPKLQPFRYTVFCKRNIANGHSKHDHRL